MKNINIPQGNMFRQRKSNRQKTEEAISEFKKILDDKTLESNKTDGYKNNVITALNNLLVSANDLDSENPGEGVFSLIVLSLRSSLKLKDRINELEYENKQLKLKIKSISKK